MGPRAGLRTVGAEYTAAGFATGGFAGTEARVRGGAILRETVQAKAARGLSLRAVGRSRLDRCTERAEPALADPTDRLGYRDRAGGPVEPVGQAGVVVVVVRRDSGRDLAPRPLPRSVPPSSAGQARPGPVRRYRGTPEQVVLRWNVVSTMTISISTAASRYRSLRVAQLTRTIGDQVDAVPVRMVSGM